MIWKGFRKSTKSLENPSSLQLERKTQDTFRWNNNTQARRSFCGWYASVTYDRTPGWSFISSKNWIAWTRKTILGQFQVIWAVFSIHQRYSRSRSSGAGSNRRKWHWSDDAFLHVTSCGLLKVQHYDKSESGVRWLCENGDGSVSDWHIVGRPHNSAKCALFDFSFPILQLAISHESSDVLIRRRHWNIGAWRESHMGFLLVPIIPLGHCWIQLKIPQKRSPSKEFDQLLWGWSTLGS